MARLGIKCKLYRNTGSWGSPTWDECNTIKDLKVDPKWDEGDAQTRYTRVKMTVKTLLGLEVTGSIQVDLTQTDYLAIVAALNGDTVIDFMILTGASDADGCRGYRFDSQVFAGTQDQSAGAVLYDEITIKPTASTNVPASVVVTSGVPVFTSLSA